MVNSTRKPRKKKLIILVFIRHYLPGFQSGGPVRSVSNMVSQLSAEMNFHIITSDRDYLGKSPYPGIENGWQRVEGAQVLYLSPDEQQWRNVLRQVEEVQPDLIYLNSFFDPVFSLPVLFGKWLRKEKMPPLICAPRGELAPGALKLKSLRKQVYLGIFKLAKLHQRICFHATSELEQEQIHAKFPHKGRTELAGNLAATPGSRSRGQGWAEKKAAQRLEIIFISRIHPKKNLDYILTCLERCQFPARFSIYGPIDDAAYWQSCQQQMAQLPHQIEVFYGGPLPHDKVIPTLENADLFFLPTHGENFGHIIHEALQAGCVLLLSDQTPWTDLDQHHVGWDLPLKDPGRFVEALEEVESWDAVRWREHETAVKQYATRTNDAGNNRQNHLNMFRKISVAGRH